MGSAVVKPDGSAVVGGGVVEGNGLSRTNSGNGGIKLDLSKFSLKEMQAMQASQNIMRRVKSIEALLPDAIPGSKKKAQRRRKDKERRRSTRKKHHSKKNTSKNKQKQSPGGTTKHRTIRTSRDLEEELKFDDDDDGDDYSSSSGSGSSSESESDSDSSDVDGASRASEAEARDQDTAASSVKAPPSLPIATTTPQGAKPRALPLSSNSVSTASLSSQSSQSTAGAQAQAQPAQGGLQRGASVQRLPNIHEMMEQDPDDAGSVALSHVHSQSSSVNPADSPANLTPNGPPSVYDGHGLDSASVLSQQMAGSMTVDTTVGAMTMGATVRSVSSNQQHTPTHGTTTSSGSSNGSSLALLFELIPFCGVTEGTVHNHSTERAALQAVRSLSREDLEVPDTHGDTLLLAACRHRAEGVVHELLALGCNVNAVNYEGSCALHYACNPSSFSDAIARALLSYNANPETMDWSYGCTPLHWAASAGDSALCHALINAGSSVVTQDLYGYTPVNYAMDAGYAQCAYELEARAHINNEIEDPNSLSGDHAQLLRSTSNSAASLGDTTRSSSMMYTQHGPHHQLEAEGEPVAKLSQQGTHYSAYSELTDSANNAHIHSSGHHGYTDYSGYEHEQSLQGGHQHDASFHRTTAAPAYGETGHDAEAILPCQDTATYTYHARDTPSGDYAEYLAPQEGAVEHDHGARSGSQDIAEPEEGEEGEEGVLFTKKHTPLKQGPEGYRALVTHTHTPASEDEMALTEGEMVRVLIAGDQHNGWWFGETDVWSEGGQCYECVSGWFPAHFVELQVKSIRQITYPPSSPISPMHPQRRQRMLMMDMNAFAGAHSLPHRTQEAQLASHGAELQQQQYHDHIQQQPENEYAMEQHEQHRDRQPHQEAHHPAYEGSDDMVDGEGLQESTSAVISELTPHPTEVDSEERVERNLEAQMSGAVEQRHQEGLGEQQEEERQHAPAITSSSPPSTSSPAPPSSSPSSTDLGEDVDDHEQQQDHHQLPHQRASRETETEETQLGDDNEGAAQGGAEKQDGGALGGRQEEEQENRYPTPHPEPAHAVPHTTTASDVEESARAARAQVASMQQLQRDLEAQLEEREAKHADEVRRMQEVSERVQSTLLEKLTALESEMQNERKHRQMLSDDAHKQRSTHEQQISELKESLEAERVRTEEKLQSLESQRTEVQGQCDAMREKLSSAKAHVEECESELKSIKQRDDQAKVAAQRTVDALRSELLKEREMRSTLHNTVLDLKGKIRIFVRMRMPEDMVHNEIVCATENHRSVTVLTPEKRRKAHSVASEAQPTQRRKTWNFDGAWGPKTNQAQVYSEVSPLVTSCVDGYNVCVFAYGQTGSGKTWTMFGDTSRTQGDATGGSGVVPRGVRELFEQLHRRRQDCGEDFKVQIEMFEIYRDAIYDVLANLSANGSRSVVHAKLREATERGGGYSVEMVGSVVKDVSTVEECLGWINRGMKNRATGQTNMNAKSSRSHLIARLTVSKRGSNGGVVEDSAAKITFVDLAGSERVNRSGVTGEALREAQSINKSLSALADVVSALTSRTDHIPYRNHPLTTVMADSLGGNSKTMMIVCASPLAEDAAETVSSFTFAKRCKNVTNRLGAGAGRPPPK